MCGKLCLLVLSCQVLGFKPFSPPTGGRREGGHCYAVLHRRHCTAADLGTDGATSSDPAARGCGQPGLTHHDAHLRPHTPGPWEPAKLCTLKASSKAAGF